MKEKHEIFLWNTIEYDGIGKPFPRDVIEMMVKCKMIENAKQAWNTLEKWDKKGLYTYGITIDLGRKVKSVFTAESGA